MRTPSSSGRAVRAAQSMGAHSLIGSMKQTVGDEELGGGGLRGVQAAVAEDLIEIKRLPA